MADESRFDPAVPEELSRRIRNRLTADLRPVKPLPSPLICFLGFSGGLGILAVALTSIMGITGLEKMDGIQLAAMCALLVTGGVLFAFLLTKQMAPALAQPISTWLAVSLFGFIAVVAPVLLFPWRAPGTDWALSWQCLIRVLVIAGGASLLLFMSMRRAAMLSAAVKGATAGAAAGLLGVAVLQFACPYQQALHLLLWHWSGLAIAAAAGAVAGSLSHRIWAGRA